MQVDHYLHYTRQTEPVILQVLMFQLIFMD